MSPLAQNKLGCQSSRQRIDSGCFQELLSTSFRCSGGTGWCDWRTQRWPHSRDHPVALTCCCLHPFYSSQLSPTGSWRRRSLQSSVWCSYISLQALNFDLIKLSILFISCVVTGNHLKPDKYWVIYSTFCHSEGSWQIFLLGYLVCNNFFDQRTALFLQTAEIFIPNFLTFSEQVTCVQEPTQLKAA